MSTPEPSRWLLHRQDQLITRSQALAAGISRRQIDGHLRTGRWHRVLPQVYLVGPVAVSARDDPSDLALGGAGRRDRWPVRTVLAAPTFGRVTRHRRCGAAPQTERACARWRAPPAARHRT